MSANSRSSQESNDLKAQPTPKEEKHGWDESLKTLIYAILLAVVFRSLLFEPFHIPSGSMKDTLLVGDYIFVSKYSYGYSRYSFPLGLPLIDGRLFESEPERGDVVVFRPPSLPRVDFIKRVIGLPGDRIQMKDSELYINDKKVPRSLEDITSGKMGNGTEVNISRYTETLPNGKTHEILDIIRNAEVDNTGVYTVPEGHYFMMGDNRDDSRDSRFLDEIGFIPKENLIGRAEIIMFSLGDDAHFWEVWKWPGSLRWERFLQKID